MVCGPGKFTLGEQVWMQVSFNGTWILGALTIARTSGWTAAAYFLFVLVGVGYFIVRRWVCPRCPHLLEHGACVQLHPWLTKQIISKKVTGGLKRYEKVGFFVALYGVPLIPIPWVVKDPFVATVFFLLAGTHYVAYHLHFCRKCLNLHCPHRALYGGAS